VYPAPSAYGGHDASFTSPLGASRKLRTLTLRCLSETEDLGSVDLPDITAARDEALRIAQAFAAAMPGESLDPSLCLIEVFDQNHQLISVVLL
jgi:hypothetical protein